MVGKTLHEEHHTSLNHEKHVVSYKKIMRKLAYHGPLTLNSLHLNASKLLGLCMRFFRGLNPLNVSAYKTCFKH